PDWSQGGGGGGAPGGGAGDGAGARRAGERDRAGRRHAPRRAADRAGARRAPRAVAGGDRRGDGDPGGDGEDAPLPRAREDEGGPRRRDTRRLEERVMDREEWKAQEPPDDFADRVMASIDASTGAAAKPAARSRARRAGLAGA